MVLAPTEGSHVVKSALSYDLPDLEILEFVD